MVLQRVGDGDRTRELAIDREEHGGFPVRLETLKRCFGRADSDSRHGHQAAVAEEDRMAEDLGSDAKARNGFERLWAIERKVSLARRAHHRDSQRGRRTGPSRCRSRKSCVTL